MPPKVCEFLFDHFKATYLFQLERMDKVRDRITFVVAILSILGTCLTYLLTEYPHAWRDRWCLMCFYVPAGIAAFFFVVSAGIVLFILIWGCLYDFIPDNKELEEFAKQMTEWGTEEGNSEDQILLEIKGQFSGRYRDAAMKNYELNSKRGAWLFKAQQGAVIAFIFAFIAIPRFYFDKSTDEAKPTKVLLVPETK